MVDPYYPSESELNSGFHVLDKRKNFKSVQIMVQLELTILERVDTCRATELAIFEVGG
jgi:hypothetical protein